MLFTEDFVEAYVNIGLFPIPCYHASKRPMNVGWNDGWSVENCLAAFRQFPGANVGILLGDIVDVEGDTPEANMFLNDLLKDHPHPQWTSAKSVHHLFLNPDPTLTRRVFQDVEFRGHRHQSIVPPSLHDSGIRYQWCEVTEFPVPPMPSSLLEFFESIPKKFRNTQGKKPEEVVFSCNHRSARPGDEQYLSKHLKWSYDLKPGHTKLWCNDCHQLCYIHKKRLILEMDVFHFIKQHWTCHECRSSDLKNYIKKECKRIRKSLR